MEPKKFFLVVFAACVFSFIILYYFAKESYLYEAPVHIGFFSAAMFFLWKKDARTTVKSLGIPGNLKKNIIAVVGGFIAITIALYIVSYALWSFEIDDQREVTELVNKLPLYLLVMAVFFAPFSEELFFRAFLVPKVGIFGSSILFALMHLSYGSVSEIAGAFTIGLILAVVYKYSKSIIPPIAIHMGFNLVAITVMLGYG